MKTLTKILGSGAFALALAVPSCRDDIAYTPEIPKATQVEEYTPREQLTERLDNPNYVPTFKDFKQSLGPRYIPGKEKELKEFLDVGDQEKRNYIALLTGINKDETIKNYQQYVKDSNPNSNFKLDKDISHIPKKILKKIKKHFKSDEAFIRFLGPKHKDFNEFDEFFYEILSVRFSSENK